MIATNNTTSEFKNLPEMTGTTIMAVKYDNGVLLGADCRTSMGSYVCGRITDKIKKLTDNIYCCVSGSSADTQAITNYITEMIHLHSFSDKEVPSVKKAAMLAKDVIYRNPSLLAGLIIAGYDEKPCIYGISLGGTIVESDWQLGGSGSAFIYGYCDVNYKPNMTLQEAINFVKQAVSCAIKRDNVSGGSIRMANITKDGVIRYFYSGEKILQDTQ